MLHCLGWLGFDSGWDRFRSLQNARVWEGLQLVGESALSAEAVAKAVCPVRSCRGVLTLSAHFSEFLCHVSSNDCIENCFTRLSRRVIHHGYSSFLLTYAQPEVHSCIVLWFVVICPVYLRMRGPGSSVGIATGYGLDGPGDRIPVGSEIFRTCPDRPWGPPSLLYNWYRIFPGRRKRTGRDADPSSPSSADV
jgi:hypothetical protein